MTDEGKPSDDNPYPHLHQSVAKMAARENKVRLAYLKADRYIPHEAAEVVMEKLGEVLSTPNTVRPPCCMVVAEPDMGKSTLFREFERLHPPVDNVDGDAAIVPVMRMQFPESGSDGVYAEIIRKLNSETTSNPSKGRLRSQALSLLNGIGNRMLIIDEVANVLTVDATKQTVAMNAIKFITNETERPIVFGVTPEAFNVVRKENHIRSRFEPIFIPRFVEGTAYRELLYGFELVLPLRKPSNLISDDTLANEILTRSLGITGKISKLLNAAAKEAINSGVEQITIDILKTIVWMDEETIKLKFREL